LCKLTKNAAPLILTDADIQYSLTNTLTDELITMLDNSGIDTGVTIIADGTATGSRYSVIEIAYTVDQTKGLTPGDNYRHELRVTEVDDQTDIYMAGPVSVVESDTLKTPPDP
jgi:hypothetical protein